MQEFEKKQAKFVEEVPDVNVWWKKASKERMDEKKNRGESLQRFLV